MKNTSWCAWCGHCRESHQPATLNCPVPLRRTSTGITGFRPKRAFKERA